MSCRVFKLLTLREREAENVEFTKDKLRVRIFDTRDEMGRAAAEDVAAAIKECLQAKPEINMIFAAAPSQNDMLYHLYKHNTFPQFYLVQHSAPNHVYI